MAGDRAPFVAVRTDVRKEERVRVIADVAGYNEHEALGRLVGLWCWCTDRGLEDAPEDCEGYAVSEAVIVRFMGPRGVAALLGDGCDELAMGGRRPDGRVYLRGTADTVSRLRSLRAGARAGGLVRSSSAGRSAGRFVSSPTIDQRPAGESPAADSVGEITTHQRAHQPSPAITSEIPDPRSLPERESLSHAGAREAGQQPGTVAAIAQPDDARARGRLAETTYRRVSDARIAIAAELKLPAPLPFPPIAPSSRAGSFRALLDRVREEGEHAALVCDRVVSNLIAQAREERTVEWLAEKAFGEGPWRTAREWMPGAAARRRGPQKGDPLPPAPAPKREPAPAPIVISDDERAEVAAMAAELRDRLASGRAS